MTITDQKSYENKIKIDNLYYFDSLPDEAKQLTRPKNSRHTIKNARDTLRLISIGKAKMIEDLKKILEPIDSIKDN